MHDRREQFDRFQVSLARYELRLRASAGRSRNAFLISAAYTYQSLGSLPAWLFEAHKLRVRDTLTAHYTKVIPHFGAMATSRIKSRKLEQKHAQSIYSALVKQWISREALRKSTMIAATDRDDVLGAIQDGMDDGLGNAEIASSIRDVSSLTAARASVIAITETHAAATFGSIESVRDAEKQLGVTMLKLWLPTLDNRTRPDHAAMDGTDAIPMGELFTVGQSMMDRPGDPSAPAEEVINCRCALGYEEQSA